MGRKLYMLSVPVYMHMMQVRLSTARFQGYDLQVFKKVLFGNLPQERISALLYNLVGGIKNQE